MSSILQRQGCALGSPEGNTHLLLILMKQVGDLSGKMQATAPEQDLGLPLHTLGEYTTFVVRLKEQAFRAHVVGSCISKLDKLNITIIMYVNWCLSVIEHLPETLSGYQFGYIDTVFSKCAVDAGISTTFQSSWYGRPAKIGRRCFLEQTFVHGRIGKVGYW
jgi:hypothetical protein